VSFKEAINEIVLCMIIIFKEDFWVIYVINSISFYHSILVTYHLLLLAVTAVKNPMPVLIIKYSSVKNLVA